MTLGRPGCQESAIGAVDYGNGRPAPETDKKSPPGRLGQDRVGVAVLGQVNAAPLGRVGERDDGNGIAPRAGREESLAVRVGRKAAGDEGVGEPGPGVARGGGRLGVGVLGGRIIAACRRDEQDVEGPPGASGIAARLEIRESCLGRRLRPLGGRRCAGAGLQRCGLGL